MFSLFLQKKKHKIFIQQKINAKNIHYTKNQASISLTPKNETNSNILYDSLNFQLSLIYHYFLLQICYYFKQKFYIFTFLLLLMLQIAPLNALIMYNSGNHFYLYYKKKLTKIVVRSVNKTIQFSEQ